MATSDCLARTFCQPSSVWFEDCLREGRIVVVALPLATRARSLIGTCLKRAFQAQVLERMRGGAINTRRPLLFLAEEYQHFISADADTKFLSVSRQNRVINLISAPGTSELLAAGLKESELEDFVGSLGTRVFMQNLDRPTKDLAGQAGGSHVAPACMPQPLPFEAILHKTTAAEPARRIAQVDLGQEATRYDPAEIIRATNDYYQAHIENRAFHFGIHVLFSPIAHAGKDCLARQFLRSWYLPRS